MTHDVAPSAIIGADGNLLSAPRLDSQGTCYTGLRALLDAGSSAHTKMLVLFDHEEVGSGSERGAPRTSWGRSANESCSRAADHARTSSN